MKKIRPVIISVYAIICLLLSSCDIEPPVFGVPKSQWDALTPAQQQQVIKGYYRHKQVEAETRSINNAIYAARDIADDRHHKHVIHHKDDPFDPHMHFPHDKDF